MISVGGRWWSWRFHTDCKINRTSVFQAADLIIYKVNVDLLNRGLSLSSPVSCFLFWLVMDFGACFLSVSGSFKIPSWRREKQQTQVLYTNVKILHADISVQNAWRPLWSITGWRGFVCHPKVHCLQLAQAQTWLIVNRVIHHNINTQNLYF